MQDHNIKNTHHYIPEQVWANPADMIEHAKSDAELFSYWAMAKESSRAQSSLEFMEESNGQRVSH